MRVESDKPCTSLNSGGWFHRLDEPIAPIPERPSKTKRVPPTEFPGFAARCERNLTPAELGQDAASLGVTPAALSRLHLGSWHGLQTFPMKSGHLNIVGIRLRARKTTGGRLKKWCVKGSMNGLFVPDALTTSGPLLLPEGPTSCAACLDLGFDAIGRPNCELGAGDIVQYLSRRDKRDIVIVADNDSPKERPNGKPFYPGKEGAAKIAKLIRPACRTLRIIMTPMYKDMREWLKNGATKTAVECIIRSSRPL